MACFRPATPKRSFTSAAAGAILYAFVLNFSASYLPITSSD